MNRLLQLARPARATSPALARAMPPRSRRLAGLGFGVLADGSVVALLALSMWLIVRAAEQPPILHLTFAIVGVRAFALGRAAFRYADRLASHDAALAQLAVLRTETFRRLIPRVPGAIEGSARGDVLARLVDDVDQLQDQPLRVWQPLVTSAVVVGGTVAVVAFVSPAAGLVLALALILGGGAAILLSARLSARSDRALSQARAALTDALLERFASAETLQVFGALGMQRDRIAAAEDALGAIQRKSAWGAGLAAAILSGVAGIATLVVMTQVSGAGHSAPAMAALIIVPTVVFEVFGAVPVAIAASRRVRESAARIDALIEVPLPAEIPIDRAPSAEVADPVPGAPLIQVSDLAVRHPGARYPAVSGVNFSLHAGHTLVVRGDSGAGKSTLALALVRLLEYGGRYTLSERDVRTLPIAEVRRTVGLCEQTPHLFDQDLRQNLAFAMDSAGQDPDDDALWAVLERVGLAEWARGRDGLDTRLGERGALVSGGQAQRIALARALLGDFPVIVLDEPTANVDPDRADALLRDLLGAVPSDRAVVLITHLALPTGITAARLELPAPEDRAR
ncbi:MULTISPECIES: thiol reductant ABC exporter subunit CydC [unclassified Leucobacter]|uniref:thiol reductant ABC exporter subunit CydC n=1 Tax=unclassified Leucobacter TaxID=2621730 RepID=UPI001F13607B|nr:thiol reductant ABC exporter subunit CydC [Leucobacter sp. CX169]